MEIEQLINRHKDAVYRQMVRTCGNHDDAEDALAEALLAAIKSSEQLRDPANFQAWLARIGTRSCARMRIREKLLNSLSLSELEVKGWEFPDDHQSPAQEAEMTSLKGCVRGAVELLPDTYREVYVRREVFGEKAEDVAESLGLSLPAVKSRLHRAREIMRTNLDSGLGCTSFIEPN